MLVEYLDKLKDVGLCFETDQPASHRPATDLEPVITKKTVVEGLQRIGQHRFAEILSKKQGKVSKRFEVSSQLRSVTFTTPIRVCLHDELPYLLYLLARYTIIQLANLLAEASSEQNACLGKAHHPLASNPGSFSWIANPLLNRLTTSSEGHPHPRHNAFRLAVHFQAW